MVWVTWQKNGGILYTKSTPDKLVVGNIYSKMDRRTFCRSREKKSRPLTENSTKKIGFVSSPVLTPRVNEKITLLTQVVCCFFDS